MSVTQSISPFTTLCSSLSRSDLIWLISAFVLWEDVTHNNPCTETSTSNYPKLSNLFNVISTILFCDKVESLFAVRDSFIWWRGYLLCLLNMRWLRSYYVARCQGFTAFLYVTLYKLHRKSASNLIFQYFKSKGTFKSIA